MTPNEKTKDGIYRRFCLFVFIFLHYELKETKLCITDHISIFLFCYELGKRKRKTNLLFSIFYYGFGKRKTKNERTIYTAQRAFPFFLFSSCKRKNENMYNGSYFYFSFFVCGLRKRKKILRYPFPIFYHEIEKRKTKGRYIHGPGCIYYTSNCYHDSLRIHSLLYLKSYFYFF